MPYLGRQQDSDEGAVTRPTTPCKKKKIKQETKKHVEVQENPELKKLSGIKQQKLHVRQLDEIYFMPMCFRC